MALWYHSMLRREWPDSASGMPMSALLRLLRQPSWLDWLSWWAKTMATLLLTVQSHHLVQGLSSRCQMLQPSMNSSSHPAAPMMTAMMTSAVTWGTMTVWRSLPGCSTRRRWSPLLLATIWHRHHHWCWARAVHCPGSSSTCSRAWQHPPAGFPSASAAAIGVGCSGMFVLTAVPVPAVLASWQLRTCEH